MKANTAIIVGFVTATAMGSYQSSAQTDPTMDATMVMNWVTGADVDAIPNWSQPHQGLIGTPFLKTEWSKATLILLSGSEMEVDLKYDIYNDQVRVRRPSGDSLIVRPGLIQQFSFESVLRNPMTFIYLISVDQEDKNSDIGYFQQVWKGEKRSLLAKWVKRMKQGEAPSGYSAGRSYDELVSKPKRYYVLEGKSLKKVKAKKSDLLKLFPTHKKEISAYLNKNKGKIKQKQLAEIVKIAES